MRGRCLLLAKAPFHDVVADLADGLEKLGWSLERRPWLTPAVPQTSAWRRLEATLSHSNRILREAARITRRAHRELAGVSAASSWYGELTPLLASDAYDVVLAFLDGAPIGLARLAARSRPRAVFVSLTALTQELQRRRALPALRVFARLLTRQPLHDDLLRAVDADALPVTVFPSVTWRDAAVSQGVPAHLARVITLGVPVSPTVPFRTPDLVSPARLLWVGRLSPEKGLHHFLEAMPAVASRRSVHLTVVAAPGPAGYARLVAETIQRQRLESIVEMRPAVPRRELIAALAHHDLLLFHSVFGEPVAQVLLHAAAAGLPVVGPASPRPGSLLRDGDTAWCYTDPSPARVADAVVRALQDGEARRERARALHDEVRRGHDLARTIEQFDAVLRAVADQLADQKVIRERSSAVDSGRRLVCH